MGFMTEVSISNDMWHVMKANPDEFFGAIDRGMQSHRIDSYPVANTSGYLKVAPSHHADEPRLYLAWRNSFVDMSHWGFKRDYPGIVGSNEHMIKFMEDNIKEAQYQLTQLKRYVKELKDGQL